MQLPTPITSSKTWKVRSDIRSIKESAPVTISKLVENGGNSCLNTANRLLPQGSPIIMYDATKVHPDNACWKTTFLIWKPIIDCFTGLALTTLRSGHGSALSTKHLTGKNNQMWAFDSKNRIVNKESGLVIDGHYGGPSMQEPTPITSSKTWKVRSDIRSIKETAPMTISKLVENGRNFCLNTANRYLNQGSSIIMYDAKDVHPDNTCWKF